MPVLDIQEVAGLIDEGRAGEVMPTLEYLSGLFPTSVTAHILLARAYEAEGAFDRALGAWQWAAALVPNSPAVQQGMERAIRAVASGAVMASDPEPFPPELVPPESDEFVDLTEQPEMPHFFNGPPVEETSAPAPEFDEPDPFLVSAPEPAPELPPRRHAHGREVPIDDLDRLIAELESARITPDPDMSTVSLVETEDDEDEMVSETLARIYAAQRQYQEAARVYDRLAGQQPDRAPEFSRKAAEMRHKASEA